MTEDRELARRLLFTVWWRGPWERLEGWFYGIRRDGSVRWDIPADPRGWRRALGAAGDFCNRRDIAWQQRHVRRGSRPWPAWRRRVPDGG